MFVLGLGLGNCMQPLLLILQSAVPPREIGVATSSATFFRQIGGTVGVAVFLSILFATVGAQHLRRGRRAQSPPTRPARPTRLARAAGRGITPAGVVARSRTTPR